MPSGMLKSPQVPERGENRDRQGQFICCSLGACGWKLAHQTGCESGPLRSHTCTGPLFAQIWNDTGKAGHSRGRSELASESEREGTLLHGPSRPNQQCRAKWVQTSRARAKDRQPTWTAVGGSGCGEPVMGETQRLATSAMTDCVSPACSAVGTR